MDPVGSQYDAPLGYGSFDYDGSHATVHSVAVATSKNTRATRNAHSRSWVVTQIGADSVSVVAWQAGASATPGVVYAWSKDGGFTWSAPIQIDASTSLRPSLVIDPATNNIYCFLLPIFATNVDVTVRILGYTGVPGTPSWGIPSAAYNQSNTGWPYPYHKSGEDLSVVVTSAGIAVGLYFVAGDNWLDAFNWTAPWNPTIATNAFAVLAGLGGTTVWADLHWSAHFGGTLFLVYESGSTVKILTAPFSAAQVSSPAFTQRAFFVASAVEDGVTSVLEQLSAAYNDTADQLCLAYVNGTYVTYRIFHWSGAALSTVVPATVITPAHTAHSPLVQACGDGSFYVLWVEDDPSSTRRSIRFINTASPLAISTLLVDPGANSWKDLDGPDVTDLAQALAFAFAETTNTDNQVYLAEVVIPVSKVVAEAGVGLESWLQNILIADSAQGVDTGDQTQRLASTACRDQQRLYDLNEYDTMGYDSPCVKYDTDEHGRATELIELSPQIFDVGLAVDALAAITQSAYQDSAVGAETFNIQQGVVTDAGTAMDVASVDTDPDPTGLANDSGTAVDAVALLEVLAADLAAAVEDFDIAQTVADAAIGTDAPDLQTTTPTGDTPDDAGTATDGIPDIGTPVDETGAAADAITLEVLVSDLGTAVEGFYDVGLAVADAAVGTEPEAPGNGAGGWPLVGPNAEDSGVAVESAGIARNLGVAATLVAARGYVRLRVSGNKGDPITTPPGS